MVKKLSKVRLERAGQFLCTEARALERAWYQYEFENGSDEAVWKELLAFQNEDGGFGQGLEPDLRCKASSALATTVALQHASLLPPSEWKETMIKDCFRYFAQTYQADKWGWEIIPQEADQEPRANWWNYSEHSEHWGNPNAEILAYLLSYGHNANDELRSLSSKLLDYALIYLQETCTRHEMHELFCFLRLYDELPAHAQKAVAEPMKQFVMQSVVSNPEDRNGYCAVPLQVAASPTTRFYSLFAEAIPHDLDQLIDEQSEQGTWGPNWAWGRYEEQWRAAKQEWTGIITLQNLRILKAYGRIE